MSPAKLARRALAGLLALTGLPALVRHVTHHKVGILLYHDPSPEVLDRHLAYLRRHYELIPFSRLVEALARRDFSLIPPHSLVIHIDDGYASNHELLRVIERHGVHVTLYLCSHIVDTQREFWSKLQGGRSKWLTRIDNGQLLEKLQREADFTPEKEYERRRALSSEEIHVMEAYVDFQSHGRFHFSMPTLRDDSLLDELWESKERVEELTGRPVMHFSFPYGDHGSREIDAVARAAYFTARTTEPGWVAVQTDRLRLPIVADVPKDASVLELRAHLTGLPRFAKRLAYRWVTRHFHATRARVLMTRRFFRPEPELAPSGGPSNPAGHRVASRKEHVPRL